MFCCKRDEQNELHGPAHGSGTQSKYLRNLYTACVISGFHCNLSVNCVLVGYYAMSGGNSIKAFCDNLLVQCSRVPFVFLVLKDGTDGLSQSVGKELPLLAE